MTLNPNPPPRQKLFNATQMLAICAFASAALSYTVTHCAFPPVGYEGMLDIPADTAPTLLIISLTSALNSGQLRMTRYNSLGPRNIVRRPQ